MRHRLPVALGTLIAAGALIRLSQFLQRPSLSVDEAMLALSVGSRSYGGLLRPLDYDQTAPLLFLWVTRFVTQLGGMNEMTLRALPLVAGLVLPLVVWRVARRLMEVPAALVCTALSACSPFLVRFSLVAKPYESDALVATALLACALGTGAAPHSPASWYRLLVAGLAGLAMAIPAAFILAGVGVALLFAPSVRATPGARGRLALVVGAWGAVFGVLYLVLYRHAATSAFMQQFWAATFLGPDVRGLPALLWRAAQQEIFPLVVGNRVPLLGIVVLSAFAAAGFHWLGRSVRRWQLALVATPLVACLGASALHRYPIAARALLFTAPLVIVILVAGARSLAGLLPRPLDAWVFGVASGGWVAAGTVIAVAQPEFSPNVRALIAEVERPTAQPPAPVYVFAGAIPTWTFYTTDWARPDTERLRSIARAARPTVSHFRDGGEDLVVVSGSRRELMGRATGIQIRYWTGPSVPQPDSGWADHEAERIRAESRPDVWLLFEAYFRDPVVRDMLDAVERAGGRRVEAQEPWQLKLFRYRFDR
jgi:4-amino-4-deoxy-L-arabinose transferase-like glycosyltransferase